MVLKRDSSGLTDQVFDVLVVGGGIHGAALARRCAQEGLKTVLVEKGDFGHATSANSLKIIHGGLRYLQHLNFKRMRHSILARRELLRLAPHYVKPLGCMIPNRGPGLQGNLFMRCALWLNDLIGSDRNKGLDESSRLPEGRILSRRECREILPGKAGEDCSGASLWYDALAVNSERLTLSLVQDAVAAGARVMNHTKLREVLVENGRVAGGRVVDLLAGGEYTVQARTLVNAGGPWIDSILGCAGMEPKAGGWAKAVNIVVRRNLFGAYAVGLRGETDFRDRDSVIRKKGRFFFFVPWRGYTMIGTSYKPFAGDPDTVRPERADIDELVREVNTIYPEAALEREDVTFAHAGLVPMTEALDTTEDVQLVKESTVIDHGCTDRAPRGFFSIRGVKYTTGLKVAEEAVEQILSFLDMNGGRPQKPAMAESTGQAGKGEILPEPFRFLEERYGTLAPRVFTYIQKNDEQVCVAPRLYLGEVDYFMAEEMACTLGDVVFRRSGLATAECPEKNVLTRIALHMAVYFSWDDARSAREVDEVLSRFTFS